MRTSALRTFAFLAIVAVSLFSAFAPTRAQASFDGNDRYVCSTKTGVEEIFKKVREHAARHETIDLPGVAIEVNGADPAAGCWYGLVDFKFIGGNRDVMRDIAGNEKSIVPITALEECRLVRDQTYDPCVLISGGAKRWAVFGPQSLEDYPSDI